MPTLRLVDGLPLVIDGKLASADNCCCVGSCCCAQCDEHYDVAYIPDDPGAFTAFLLSKGYAGVTYHANTPYEGHARWVYNCCLTNPADQYPYTFTHDGTETTVYISACVSAEVDGCATGLTKGECDAVKGTWRVGEECSVEGCDCSLTNYCPDNKFCYDSCCRPCEACNTGVYVCAEIGVTGADCTWTGPDAYAASGELITYPCKSPQLKIGFQNAGPMCPGLPYSTYALEGEISCPTMTFDSEGNCTASECEWINVVGYWRDPEIDGQCDCILELTGYTIRASDIPCP